MPRSNCDPCCNPTELARSQDSWRDANLQILCEIATNTAGGGGGGGGGTTRFEYLICDNGVNKIVDLSVSPVGVITVSYLLLDRTASVVPADWTLVRAGGCSGIFAEDAASASGDLGQAVLYKRLDTAAAQTSADGDYSLPVVNQFGQQRVGINRSFQATDADSILKAEDAAHTTGDAGVMALSVRADTAVATTSATGDYSQQSVNSFGASLVDARSDFQSSATLGLLKLEDVAHVTGDAGVLMLGVRADTAAATTSATGDYAQHSVNSFGAQLVDVRSDFQSSATLGLLKIEDAVSASGDAGVLNFGVRRDALDTAQTSNAGDYAWHINDSLGRQIINPYAPTGSYVYGNASVTDTSSTILVTAAAGSLRNYITNISVTNTGATTVLITLQDGSGGTAIWRTIAAASGGSNISLQVPIRTTAATALYFAAGGSSTTVYVSVSGFTAL